MTTPADHLAKLEPQCTVDDALALFDSLPSIREDELRGRWRGRELGTGHAMDGLLDATGWYGKQFDSAEEVHPLLFAGRGGRIINVDPRRIPFGLAGLVPAQTVACLRKFVEAAGPVISTRKPRARLRSLEYRGVTTAVMIYDHLPIIDVFRRIDADTVLGAMDLRGDESPYFFILQRD